MSDWREPLAERLGTTITGEAVRAGTLDIGGGSTVTALWDFSVAGGSFGEADTTAFVAAVDLAIERRRPLVTLLRTGGTKLPEGMHALVGIPRAVLALQRLRASGLPHIAVCDQPTTGGVWVAIASTADIRIAVAGATIGFSGPRVVTAMTGRDPAAGALTAESAHAAGLVDRICPGEQIEARLGDILRLLAPDKPEPVDAVAITAAEPVDGWDQIESSRQADRPTGDQLQRSLLGSTLVPLRGADESVTAAIGRIAGRRVIVVALDSGLAGRSTPAGFHLLRRAAGLAGSLDLALITLIDTEGADPHSEDDGLVVAIATGMLAVLDCRAPTVSLIHGAGGSGGALAGAVTDVVLIGTHGWFAALGAEGAAAALRSTPEDAARLMHVTPADLLASGLADAAVREGDELAAIAAAIDRLRRQAPAAARLAARNERWSAPLR